MICERWRYLRESISFYAHGKYSCRDISRTHHSGILSQKEGNYDISDFIN